MENRAPQLAINADHGPYHPQNLLLRGINAFARLEHWRRTAPGPEYTERLQERKAALRDKTDRFKNQQYEIMGLKMAATLHPEIYEADLQEALRSYHSERASALGERALSFRSRGSMFAGLREAVIEKRQSHHTKKARKAANALLQLF